MWFKFRRLRDSDECFWLLYKGLYHYIIHLMKRWYDIFSTSPPAQLVAPWSSTCIGVCSVCMCHFVSTHSLLQDCWQTPQFFSFPEIVKRYRIITRNWSRYWGFLGKKRRSKMNTKPSVVAPKLTSFSSVIIPATCHFYRCANTNFTLWRKKYMNLSDSYNREKTACCQFYFSYPQILRQKFHPPLPHGWLNTILLQPKRFLEIHKAHWCHIYIFLL